MKRTDIDWSADIRYAGLGYLDRLSVGRRSNPVVSVEGDPGRAAVAAVTRHGDLGAGPARRVAKVG